jgi:hypothetical protein
VKGAGGEHRIEGLLLHRPLLAGQRLDAHAPEAGATLARQRHESGVRFQGGDGAAEPRESHGGSARPAAQLQQL